MLLRATADGSSKKDAVVNCQKIEPGYYFATMQPNLDCTYTIFLLLSQTTSAHHDCAVYCFHAGLYSVRMCPLEWVSQ